MHSSDPYVYVFFFLECVGLVGLAVLAGKLARRTEKGSAFVGHHDS
jgi:hypothetical protein